jgi:pyrroline-5-carboxylate reductase
MSRRPRARRKIANWSNNCWRRSAAVEPIAAERLMDVVTAVSGSGPAYVFLLAEVLAAAAEQEGLDRETAMRLASQTVAGAGALMLETGGACLALCASR